MIPMPVYQNLASSRPKAYNPRDKRRKFAIPGPLIFARRKKPDQVDVPSEQPVEDEFSGRRYASA
jgi:hypothetical protein